MNKKFKSLILSFVFIFCLITSVFANADVKLWINGNFIESDVAPVVENNRTLVPIRIITENLGYEVNWNPETKEVKIIENEDSSFTFIIGEKGYYAGDVFNNSDVAPKIINNRTFIPLRTIAEVTGNNVDWDANKKVAIVGYGYNSNDTVTENIKAESSEKISISNQYNLKIMHL